MSELTPFESAIVAAHDVAAGLAASALVQDLIRQDLVAKKTLTDRQRTDAERKQALNDSRHINLLLSMIAEQRALGGVAA